MSEQKIIPAGRRALRNWRGWANWVTWLTHEREPEQPHYWPLGKEQD